MFLVQSCVHEVCRGAYLVRLDEAQQRKNVLRGGAAAHFLHLLIHDSELPVINDERNQQARCPDQLNDSLYFLKRIHFVIVTTHSRLLSLATDDIDDREDNDPHGVNEVPVPGEHLDALAIGWLEAP